MNQQLPIHLYKAHVELQLQITRLLQECGQQWFDAMRKVGAESTQETAKRIQGVHQVTDWKQLGALPSEDFWRAYQGHVGDVQTFTHAAAQSQALLAQGLGQALVNWQLTVSGALGAVGPEGVFARGVPGPGSRHPAPRPTSTGRRRALTAVRAMAPMALSTRG